MKVAGRLRSCLGPLKLTHHGVLWSLRWRKPQKLHWSPFEWTSKSLLWYRFRCVAWKSRQPSFTALSSREIFIFLWIRLSFIHKTHALSSFFSSCHVWKLGCFCVSRFGRISLNISSLGSACRPKSFRQVSNSTCRSISVCELLHILTLMVWHSKKALVLFNQSDYFNHSNKDSDWPIVACFMRV